MCDMVWQPFSDYLWFYLGPIPDELFSLTEL